MKTKRKGKEKKREREKKKKKKQVLPGIELRTFRTPGRFVVTTPRETHFEIFDNILLKAFSLEFIHSLIHSFYFAINQKYNNSIQKYIKDNIQYSN